MTTKGLFIPPILIGTKFAGLEKHEHHTAFVFLSDNPAVDDGVIRATIITKGNAPIYAYSIVDSDTNTIRHYHGPHGDPSKDTWDEIKSLSE